MGQPEEPKWNAGDYAKNSSAQLGWARELIDKLKLKGNESIVDIGSGDGKVTAMLAQAVPDGLVLGLDASEQMVSHAAEQFPSSQYSNLSFTRMDAQDIRLPRQFDLAFSSATLHWVKDQLKVLAGVRDCLKPGGKLLFQMGGAGNAKDIIDTIAGEVIQRPRWKPYFKDMVSPYFFYGPEEYRNWLEQSGFKPVRVELIGKDMEQNGVEGLKGWLRTTWFPYIDRVPEHLRDAFLNEIVGAYISGFPLDAKGNTHVHMVRLEVEALAP